MKTINLLPTLIIATFITGSLLGAGATISQSAPTDRPDEEILQVLEGNDQRIVLELTTPQFVAQQVTLDGLECQQLDVQGFSATDRPGWPALPVRGAMLGIPVGVDLSLQVLDVEDTVLPGPYTICPTKQAVFSPYGSPQDNYQDFQVTPDEEAYQLEDFTPNAPVELVGEGFIRSQRIAQLRFMPFQYNPSSGELRVVERLVVELTFSGDIAEDARTSKPTVEAGDFESVLSASLLNYESARAWRTHAIPTAQKPALSISESSRLEVSDLYKVSVDQDGIYEITYGDLFDAGIPTATLDSLDPRTFRMTNKGGEIEIFVTGQTDGDFNTTDVIIFYGQKENSIYTNTNVYWLSWGGADGLRMGEVDGTPGGTAVTPTEFLTTQRMEVDFEYQTANPSGPDKDPWYWEFIIASGSSETRNYTTELTNVSTNGSLNATVRGLFKGFDADPNHHTLVYLNGNLIDDATWDPEDEYSFEVTVVPQSYLVEGTNTITLEIPLDGGINYNYLLVNWFEIDYYDTYTADSDNFPFEGDQAGTWEYQLDGFSSDVIDLFDITTPAAPDRILNANVAPSGGGYQAAFEHTITGETFYRALTPASRLSPISIDLYEPADLKSTSNGADYIVISHPYFLTQIQPLVDWRTSQGFRVKVVDVLDVYDEFSSGNFDARAIQDFLQYAYGNWVSPAPSYVLLVGDGNFDFKDNFGYGETNYIPPLLDDVDPWIGETATDNRFVSVSGSDIFPDMHIGRLPVQTTTETSSLVTKILDYEQNPPVDDWNTKVTFVADNQDGGGNFPVLSDAIIDNHLPGAYTEYKIYYNVTHSPKEAAQQAIIDDINEGRLLVNYIGHAAIPWWAGEKLLQLSSIASLTNSDRLPFMVPMTCNDGYFQYPSSADNDYSAIGEALVVAESKGAIGSFSPTGYGVASGHDYLNKALYDEFLDKGNTAFGPATTAAKLHLYSSTGSHRELIETYLLFGDPATKLQIPEATASLSLVAGWNLIALPLEPSEAIDAQSLLDDINEGSGTCTEIDRWKDDTWDAHIDGLTFNNYAVNTGEGYFIKCTQSVDWVVRGESLSSAVPLDLVPGWNLVGVPYPASGFNAQVLLDDINGQGGACSEIDRWKDDTWDAHIDGLSFNNFDILPDAGYFVKCTQASSYTPNP